MSIARQIDHSVRRNQPRSLGKAQPKRREPGVPPPPKELVCGHPASDSNLRLDVAAGTYDCRACKRIDLLLYTYRFPARCRRGHLYDRGDGMGVRIGSKGERRCRECVNESARKSRMRRKGEQFRRTIERWRQLKTPFRWY